MHQRKVSFQFRSLKDLLDYNITIDIKNCEIDEHQFTITCELTEADIELAKAGYKAVEVI